MFCPEDGSSWADRLGTDPPGDGLSWDQIVLGTERPRDGSPWGQIITKIERTDCHGDGSFRDGSSGHRIPVCKLYNCLGMACFTYNSVFALSGPPTVANTSIDRRALQVIMQLFGSHLRFMHAIFEQKYLGHSDILRPRKKAK
jgi:hypothetical protein